MRAEASISCRICRYVVIVVMVGVCLVTVLVSAGARENCPLQQHIPYWNMVTCVLLLLIIAVQILKDIGLIGWCSDKIASTFIEKLDKNRKKELKIFKNHGQGFVYVALFIWFIPGIAWIFTNINHFIDTFINKKEKFNCDFATYILGAVIIIIIFMFAMIKFITKLIHSRRKWEERLSAPEITKNPLPERYRVKIPVEEPIEVHSDEDVEGIEVG